MGSNLSGAGDSDLLLQGLGDRDDVARCQIAGVRRHEHAMVLAWRLGP
jgi:hypothetical protein